MPPLNVVLNVTLPPLHNVVKTAGADNDGSETIVTVAAEDVVDEHPDEDTIH